jgi:hypothetical protein
MQRVIFDCSLQQERTVDFSPLEEETRLQEIEANRIVSAVEDTERAAVVVDYSEAKNAVITLQAFIDRTSPTTAQTVAAVKLLARICIILIRHTLRAN